MTHPKKLVRRGGKEPGALTAENFQCHRSGQSLAQGAFRARTACEHRKNGTQKQKRPRFPTAGAKRGLLLFPIKIDTLGNSQMYETGTGRDPVHIAKSQKIRPRAFSSPHAALCRPSRASDPNGISSMAESQAWIKTRSDTRHMQKVGATIRGNGSPLCFRRWLTAGTGSMGENRASDNFFNSPLVDSFRPRVPDQILFEKAPPVLGRRNTIE